MHLHNLTIKNFHEGLLKKEFSALEVAEAYYWRITEKDPEIGAYLTLTRDLAMRQAEAADVKVAKGEQVGPLEGVPIAVKDNILIQGERVTAGSKILADYVAPYDAGVVTKLRGAGAVFLGKTNLDEFAMGASTENSGFHVTKNPHDTTRVPGGSSGGSAAAVAAHMALGALGSDTGGSIRQPAAFSGVVGLKPTYGAVSRSGLIAMASSLDQIGPITRTVEDAEILFRAIEGKDAYDATSRGGGAWPEPTFEEIKKMKIGLPEEYFIPGMEPEVVRAMEEVERDFKSLGMEVKRVNLPHTRYALSCYYIIVPAEVSSNLARYDGIRYGTSDPEKLRHGASKRQATSLVDRYRKVRSHGLGAEVKRRVILGTFVLSSGYYDAYYSKAQKVRRLVKEDFEKAFKEVDILLTPVSPTRAFKIGEKADDPLAMYLADVFTIPANLAGVPAISIPVRQATSDRRQETDPIFHVASPMSLPVGFQLIGKHFHESDLFAVGKLYERLSS